jgi:hypothetical protein
MLLIDYVSIQQALQKEVEDSKRWIECTVEDSTGKSMNQKNSKKRN